MTATVNGKRYELAQGKGIGCKHCAAANDRDACLEMPMSCTDKLGLYWCEIPEEIQS
jgi:hypothetical protein